MRSALLQIRQYVFRIAFCGSCCHGIKIRLAQIHIACHIVEFIFYGEDLTILCRHFKICGRLYVAFLRHTLRLRTDAVDFQVGNLLALKWNRQVYVKHLAWLNHFIVQLQVVADMNVCLHVAAHRRKLVHQIIEKGRITGVAFCGSGPHVRILTEQIVNGITHETFFSVNENPFQTAFQNALVHFFHGEIRNSLLNCFQDFCFCFSVIQFQVTDVFQFHSEAGTVCMGQIRLTEPVFNHGFRQIQAAAPLHFQNVLRQRYGLVL